MWWSQKQSTVASLNNNNIPEKLNLKSSLVFFKDFIASCKKKRKEKRDATNTQTRTRACQLQRKQ
jgi:hypothetical protein